MNTITVDELKEFIEENENIFEKCASTLVSDDYKQGRYDLYNSLMKKICELKFDHPLVSILNRVQKNEDNPTIYQSDLLTIRISDVLKYIESLHEQIIELTSKQYEKETP